MTNTAILLVGLGTPNAPTASEVRPWLSEFLRDQRVVSLPAALWWPILYGVILPLRPKKVAAKYAKIWLGKSSSLAVGSSLPVDSPLGQGSSLAAGSPLAVHTRALSEAIAQVRPQLTVAYAMRYGQPSVASVLDRLTAAAADHIIIIPLYPQYSIATTASVYDAVARWQLQQQNLPSLSILSSFAEHPAYIDALATSVKRHWQQHGALPADKSGRLILSFHSVPQRQIDRGDPYAEQCQQTAAALTQTLGLSTEQYLVCYHSRFGAGEWIGPETSVQLETLYAGGVRRFDVICPGFLADCLETLWDIDWELRRQMTAGAAGLAGADVTAGAEGIAGADGTDGNTAGVGRGVAFHYIPCLNARQEWVDALSQIIDGPIHQND